MFCYIFLTIIIFISTANVNVNCLCPEGIFEWQENCYIFVNDSSGFANAESFCAEKGGHLASIHDGFTNALLAQKGSTFFHESTMIDFWIGLSNLIIPGNWTWIDGTKLDFIEWGSKEPKNITGTNCATLPLSNNGQWKSDDCYKLKPYVCAVEKAIFEPTTTSYPIFTNCTRPFIYFEPTHSCYGVGIITNNNLNWSDAESFCESYGGHSVSIHSYEEESLVYAFINYSDQQTWSGLFSNDEGKTWKWSDGTLLDYNPWGFGHGSFANYSGCGLIHRASISGESCSLTLRVLCKVVL